MVAEYNINTTLLDEEKAMSILAVEDDAESIGFLEAQITALGHKALTATDGQKALGVLESGRGKVDVVLMKRDMPVMDGMSVLKCMQENPDMRRIPVVMVTDADSPEDMKQGLGAGVFYYLTKPVQEDALRSVLSAAVREVKRVKILTEELSKHKTGFQLIETAKFKFQTLAQAESLAAFIANCFPDPGRVLPGLGELLINAVEHGNLGIGYAKKTELIEDGIWRSEVERLQQSPEHIDKAAFATVAQKPGGTYVVIEDQGIGFEWENFIKIDPVRAADNHGRGIAQAATSSFDKLTYNEHGNQVVAFVGDKKQLDW